jgi:ribosomal protein S18 acetylase RimI-like enzyme
MIYKEKRFVFHNRSEFYERRGMSKMKIRVMNISDYKQVYQLWLSCVGMGLNNLDDSKEGIERFLNRNPETCFVAEIEQMIIGVIIAGNDGRRGYIYHTAVNPNYRHQGIATKLVNEVMGKLKALGIHKTALVVFSKNTDGNAFWEKNGFTSREDLIYRNKPITEMIRIDT